MKHTLSVTVLMVLIFLLSQTIGLYAISANTIVTKTPEGQVVVEHEDTALGERPHLEGPQTFLYILMALAIGTGLIFLIMKLKKIVLWKLMFFFAVWMTCSITLAVFIKPLSPLVAFAVCFVLALIKISRPNIWIHNISELLIYAGIALIFVPLLDMVWVTILLLAISAYDMFAVWRSKHMVSLAEFQTKSKAFAGVMLSYKTKMKERVKKSVKSREEKGEFRNAILGGGDIAFPMIFAGVAMTSLIQSGVAKPSAFLQGMIIPVVVAIVLFTLLVKAKKDKFYPAMPFMTFGCFVGYAIIWFAGFI